jgi:hypothetical protein
VLILRRQAYRDNASFSGRPGRREVQICAAASTLLGVGSLSNKPSSPHRHPSKFCFAVFGKNRPSASSHFGKRLTFRIEIRRRGERAERRGYISSSPEYQSRDEMSGRAPQHTNKVVTFDGRRKMDHVRDFRPICSVTISFSDSA